jgi:hypothetical protein
MRGSPFVTQLLECCDAQDSRVRGFPSHRGESLVSTWGLPLGPRASTAWERNESTDHTSGTTISTPILRKHQVADERWTPR